MASSWIAVHAALLHALARITGRSREALYPVDRSGKPDLRYYTAPLAHYVAMYEAYLDGLRAGGGRRVDGRRLFALRVHAVWGLVAQGAASADFARALLRHEEADAREDGAAILVELGR
jgi:hypothetical protein